MHIGGPQSWVCDIAPALMRRGAKVTVMSFEGAAAPSDLVLLQRLETEGIETRRITVCGGRWRRLRTIHSAFKALSRCDIAHFNSDAYSGPFLPFAKLCGIPVRIMHARTPGWRPPGPGLYLRLYYDFRWWLTRRYSTHAFGVTQQALDAMLGPARRHRVPSLVVPSAICFARFRQQLDTRTRRDRVEGKTDLIVGFVGRMSPMKNPVFLVKVLSVLRARGIEARLLFMGSGSAEAEVRDLVAKENLTNQVELLPAGGNVAEVMAQRMDIVVLPSDYEGTPRVIIESQASGVPVLCSMAVSTDVCVVPELFHRLPLAEGPAVWADEVLRVAQISVSRERVKDCFDRSPLEIENQAEHLMALYRSYLAQEERYG